MQEEPRNKHARHPGAAAAFDEVRRDGEVLVNEIRRVGGVRVDAADFGRGDDDDVRFSGGEEIENRALVAEIELVAGGGEDLKPPRRPASRTRAEPTMPRWPAMKSFFMRLDSVSGDEFVGFGQRHGGDLVHVVIAVGGEAADEAGVLLGGGEFRITLIGRAGVGGGDRIEWLVAGRPVLGELPQDGAGGDVLAGGVFDFDDPGEGDLRRPDSSPAWRVARSRACRKSVPVRGVDPAVKDSCSKRSER